MPFPSQNAIKYNALFELVEMFIKQKTKQKNIIIL